MTDKKLIILLFALMFPGVLFCTSSIPKSSTYRLPFYIGALGGYGSTTWGGLVPASENQNIALNLSTPVEVSEGGGVWGAFIGKELFPNFALEAAYIHYPNANVYFDPISLFSFDNDGMTEFVTQTETVSLMGKIFLPVPNSTVKIYSSLGAASVHRQDVLNNDWRLSPTFGAGITYAITKHWVGELAGNYTAGYGESQLNPTAVYYPFLYSVTLRLAYVIN